VSSVQSESLRGKGDGTVKLWTCELAGCAIYRTCTCSVEMRKRYASA